MPTACGRSICSKIKPAFHHHQARPFHAYANKENFFSKNARLTLASRSRGRKPDETEVVAPISGCIGGVDLSKPRCRRSTGGKCRANQASGELRRFRPVQIVSILSNLHECAFRQDDFRNISRRPVLFDV
jgi:hypothetical protein